MTWSAIIKGNQTEQLKESELFELFANGILTENTLIKNGEDGVVCHFSETDLYPIFKNKCKKNDLIPLYMLAIIPFILQTITELSIPNSGISLLIYSISTICFLILDYFLHSGIYSFNIWNFILGILFLPLYLWNRKDYKGKHFFGPLIIWLLLFVFHASWLSVREF